MTLSIERSCVSLCLYHNRYMLAWMSVLIEVAISGSIA